MSNDHSNDGRLVREMWFDSGEAACRVMVDENHILKYVIENRGDHENDWVLMIRKADGVEVERHNPRFASSIHWVTP